MNLIKKKITKTKTKTFGKYLNYLGIVVKVTR